MDNQIELVRDTVATIIPAGNEHTLKAGTKAVISQALGGSVTIRTSQGLYRIASKDLDALGDAAQGVLASSLKESENSSEPESFSEELLWEAMKRCYDPEIPVNVVDLGLIYDLQIQPSPDAADYTVQVKMTLTAQGCGMGPVIADDVKSSIESLPQVREAQVDIVWDPPWTPHMISEVGRQKLGLD